jgi:hypothetical protein
LKRAGTFGLAQAELAGFLRGRGRTAEAADLWAAARRNDLTLSRATGDEGLARRELGQKDLSYTLLVRAVRERPGDTALKAAIERLLAEDPGVRDRDRAKREQARSRKLGQPLELLPWASGDLVRVGLIKRAEAVTLRSRSPLAVEDSRGRLLATWPAGRDLVLGGADAYPSEFGAAPRSGQGIRFSPVEDFGVAVLGLVRDPGTYWGTQEDLEARGRLQAVRGSKGWTLVNEVLAETYVLGVLPGEMPAAYPLEALKAQAVAARSDVLAKRGRHAREGYDVCAGAHCAVYRGSLDEAEPYRRAVRETTGLVLEKNGKPVPALFIANCGGIGHAAEEAWGNRPVWDGGDRGTGRSWDLRPEGKLPEYGLPQLFDFLKKDSAAWCGGTGEAAHRWVSRLEPGAVLARAGALEGSSLESLWVQARDGAGYVREIGLKIRETAGAIRRKNYKNDWVRTVLPGARSNLFILMARRAGGEAGGQGVGLGQLGAGGRATAGQDFRAILAAYLPDCALGKRW